MNQLQLEYVPLATVVLWDRNAKLHDVGGIIESIERYGFKDPPKFEPKLNGGEGGIVEGNGRVICLQIMKDEGRDPPKGILEADGDWAVPVLFGVDAISESAAEAYAIDHNNLTLTGGDHDLFDLARLWSPDYTDILASMDYLPITMEQDAVAALTAVYTPPTLEELEEEFGEPDPSDGWPFIRVCVSPATLALWESVMSQTEGEDDEKVAHLLGCIDMEAFTGK